MTPYQQASVEVTAEQCAERCKTDKFWYVHCPNNYESGGDMECERYKCKKCPSTYTLYYDEMR